MNDLLPPISIILAIAGLGYLFSGSFLTGGILLTLSVFLLALKFGWIIFLGDDWYAD